MTAEPARRHHGVQHARRSVGQDRPWSGRQPFQSRRYLGKAGEAQVRVHEPADLRLAGRQGEPVNGVTQRRLGHQPEIFVALHEGAQPRVFELLLTPHGRQRGRVAGDLASSFDDRVNIEERAVRVEDEPADAGSQGVA